MLPFAPSVPSSATAVASLDVWFGSMPESNGKTNWTAILHRDGQLHQGLTLARSEIPGRVRYCADQVLYLLGKRLDRPCVIDYDGDFIPPAETLLKAAAWVAADGEGAVDFKASLLSPFPTPGATVPVFLSPPGSHVAQAMWVALTPSLLVDIELDEAEEWVECWIFSPGMHRPVVGRYEWRQGSSPHGFETCEGRVSADSVTHVMRIVRPETPSYLMFG